MSLIQARQLTHPVALLFSPLVPSLAEIGTYYIPLPNSQQSQINPSCSSRSTRSFRRIFGLWVGRPVYLIVVFDLRVTNYLLIPLATRTCRSTRSPGYTPDLHWSHRPMTYMMCVSTTKHTIRDHPSLREADPNASETSFTNVYLLP